MVVDACKWLAMISTRFLRIGDTNECSLASQHHGLRKKCRSSSRKLGMSLMRDITSIRKREEFLLKSLSMVSQRPSSRNLWSRALRLHRRLRRLLRQRLSRRKSQGLLKVRVLNPKGRLKSRRCRPRMLQRKPRDSSSTVHDLLFATCLSLPLKVMFGGGFVCDHWIFVAR